MPPEAVQAFRQLLTFQTGDDDAPLRVIRAAIDSVKHSFGRSREYETRLVQVLSRVGLSTEAETFAAEQLHFVATEKSVRVYERLLYRSHTQDISLLALEEIPGLDAQYALLRALSATKGEFRVRIIRTLARREEPEVVPDLVKLTGKGDPRVIEAAIRALGEIGGPEAVKDLLWCRRNVPTELRPVATDALFRCAAKYTARGDYVTALDMYDTLFVEAEPPDVRNTALQGMIRAERDKGANTIVEVLTGTDHFLYDTALAEIPGVPGNKATRRIVDIMEGLPAQLQGRVMLALALRGDPIALPSINEAAGARDPVLRFGALRALAAIGDGTSVPILLISATARDAKERSIARESLLKTNGPAVNDALIQAALGSNNAIRAEAVRTILARDAKSGIPVLFHVAERDVEPLQIEALRALKEMASETELPDLVNLLVQASRPAVRDEAVRAVVATAMRLDKSADRTFAVRDALQKEVHSPETRVILVDMLGEIGDDSGLPALRTVARRRDPIVDRAVVRVYAKWRTAAPLDDALRLAERIEEPSLSAAAFDAFFRMLQMPSERHPDESLKYYKKAVRLAATPDQKRKVLDDLTDLPAPSSAKLIEFFLTDPDIAELAAAAMDAQAGSTH